MRQINRITVSSAKLAETVTFAVVTDLHNGPWRDAEKEMLAADAVLVPGDLVDRHSNRYDEAVRFLREMSARTDVFVSVGNHERKLHDLEGFRKLADETAAVLLHNRSVRYRGLVLGGLSSAEPGKADTGFLDRFQTEEGFRLLLCHHPEMYRDYVSGRPVDLTLCGHAHGGQVKIFGHGLYAPGQGVFPKMTDGFYDGGRMFLSRGMTNGARAPRINVPTELIVLTLKKEK